MIPRTDGRTDGRPSWRGHWGLVAVRLSHNEAERWTAWILPNSLANRRIER